MLQNPAVSVCVHVPVASLQESVVHERPSAQLEVVWHTLAALQTPQPSADPSLQRAPVAALQAVWLAVGSQVWQGLLGFTVAAA